MLDTATDYARAMVMLSCARHQDITMLMSHELSTRLCSMKLETEEMSKPNLISRNRHVELSGRLAVQHVHATFINGAPSYG